MMTLHSNHHLFISSYAPDGATGIYGFLFDSATGKLTPKSGYSGVESPSFIAVHPNGRWLYAVSETGIASHGRHGAVYALAIDPETLELSPINHQSAGGDWTCHVDIDRSGQWLIATNYGSGDAALFPIAADGGLGKMGAFVQHTGSGPNKDRQEGAHAHSAVFTPDNKFVIIADLGIDQLVMYAFDDKFGTLTKHAEITANPGSGPRHFTFHPNQQIVYCANELDSSVTAYRYEPAVGTLNPFQTVSTLPAANPDSFVADIHLSASGERLYVSNRGDNSIAVFSVAADGRLTPLGFPFCGGNWPRNFALGPTGRHLLVANRRTNDVVSFLIDSDHAEEIAIQDQVSILEPSCIKILS